MFFRFEKIQIDTRDRLSKERIVLWSRGLLFRVGSTVDNFPTRRTPKLGQPVSRHLEFSRDFIKLLHYSRPSTLTIETLEPSETSNDRADNIPYGDQTKKSNRVDVTRYIDVDLRTSTHGSIRASTHRKGISRDFVNSSIPDLDDRDRWRNTDSCRFIEYRTTTRMIIEKQ